MSDLRELYQQVILDHNRKPRNFRAIEGPHRHADGHNPLCGDKLRVYVDVEDDRITDVSFLGEGCAISKASASLMTQHLKGKTVAEAKEIFEEFHEMVTGGPGEHPPSDKLGKLAVFQGVCEFPVRVKCATLAWHTLEAALEDGGEKVTTE
jgi:nitrogen fixation NifU-like protein